MDADLDRLLALFNRDEGWFLEYNGADAGYQTRCLRYLVKIAALTGREDLWAIAGQAAGFVEQLLIPKVQGQANVPEYWRNGGGGVGGPIVKNRTFWLIV